MPQSTPYDVFGGALKGFHVRVHTSGAKGYRLKYVSGGKQRAMSIGAHGAPWTPGTASMRAEVMRGAVKDGGDPIADRVAKSAALAEAERSAMSVSVSVSDLIEGWLTLLENSNSTSSRLRHAQRPGRHAR